MGRSRSLLARCAKHSRWHLVYRGTNGAKATNLHYATSEDGVAWTRHGVVAEKLGTLVGLVHRASRTELFYSCGSAVCLAELKDPS